MSALVHMPTRIPTYATNCDAVPAYHGGVDLALSDARKIARDAVLGRERDPLWQAMAYFDPL